MSDVRCQSPESILNFPHLNVDLISYPLRQTLNCNPRCLILDSGRWLLVAGYWWLDTGHWLIEFLRINQSTKSTYSTNTYELSAMSLLSSIEHPVCSIKHPFSLEKSSTTPHRSSGPTPAQQTPIPIQIFHYRQGPIHRRRPAAPEMPLKRRHRLLARWLWFVRPYRYCKKKDP